MTQTSRSLNQLLDKVEQAAGESGSVSLADILERIGERSFTPLILIVALLMVTPLSGSPGAPTTSGVIILMLAGQALMDRPAPWLPGFLTRR